MMCRFHPAFVLLLLALSLASFFACSNGLSTGPLLFKRSVQDNAAQLLDQFAGQQNDCMGFTNLTDAMKARYASLAAFVFAIPSTYFPHKQMEKELAKRNITAPTVLPPELNALVPEKFYQFFGSPTGNNDKPTEVEIQSMDCVEQCMEATVDKMQAKVSELKKAISEYIKSGQKGGIRSLSFNISCSDEYENRDCIAHCHAKSNSASMYTKYFLHELDQHIQRHCPNREGQLDVFRMIDSCKGKRFTGLAISFAFNQGNQFVEDFKKAEDDGQRCAVVKQTLVVEMANWMAPMCDQPEQAAMVERASRAGAAYVLAQNTEGAIFRRCPEIYNTDDF